MRPSVIQALILALTMGAIAMMFWPLVQEMLRMSLEPAVF
jgi:hypothetical protein